MTLGACTSGLVGPSATDAPVTSTVIPLTTTTTIAATEAVEEFRTCLVEAGIAIEEIPWDAQGRPRLDLVMATIDLSDPEVATSLTGCSQLLTGGALDRGGDDLLREVIVDRLQEYSRCMVSRGVEDFPDPVPGFSGIGPPYPVAEIPYADPELPGAAEECRVRLLERLESLEDDF